MEKSRGKVIYLQPPQYIPGKAPAMSLLYPMLKVFYEEGILTWDEYATKVPVECRPLKYRTRPSS